MATIPPRERSHRKDKESSEEKGKDNSVCCDSASCCDHASILQRIDNSDEAVRAEANNRGYENVAGEREQLSHKSAKETSMKGCECVVKQEGEVSRLHKSIDDIKEDELLIFAREFLTRTQQVKKGEDI